MRKVLFSICVLMTLQVINAQQESFVIWSFETKGKILSHPIIDSDHIYFGSDDKILYAIDINSGKQVWAYKTNLRIRSKPLIFEDIVYFNSGNDIYALNKRTGKEEWISVMLMLILLPLSKEN